MISIRLLRDRIYVYVSFSKMRLLNEIMYKNMFVFVRTKKICAKLILFHFLQRDFSRYIRAIQQHYQLRNHICVLLEMNFQPKAIVFIVAVNFIYIESANILVMIPLAFYSHCNSFQPMFRELAVRGHNVTVFSCCPQKKPIQNLTDIVLPNYFHELLDSTSSTKSTLDLGPLRLQITGYWNPDNSGLMKALQHEEIQKLLKNKDTDFDLVITETWFGHEAFVAFGHKFKAPVINLMPSFLFSPAAYLTGNHFSLSYIPVVKPGFSARMTFFERVQNVYYYYRDIIVEYLFYFPLQEAMMRKYFKYPGSENLPPLEDMLRNTSLTLVDAHFAFGYPMPYHNNIVLYGGANLQQPAKLPNDLQNFMDDADNGVIYFSLGSYLSLQDLKPYVIDIILSTLGSVKQKVLLRANYSISREGNYLNNILIRKWFPQASVLAHPNCKLFITHGGIHSLMEGIHYAVPMIAIPFIGDQRYNALFIESAGIGHRLDVENISREKMLYTINSIVNKPSYKEKMNLRSAIFRDNPMNIMDNVIYWIEYVIRHKGAPHLRPAVLDLHWYQYLMLDVIAFYLLILICTVFIIDLVTRALYKYLNILIINFVFLNKKSKKE